LLLDGVEKDVRRRPNDPVDMPKREWSYVFKVENTLKNKFTNFGESCYTWATFACCKSILKEKDALLIE